MERSEIEQLVFGELTVLSNKLDKFSLKCLDELTLKQFFLIQYINYLENSKEYNYKPCVREVADISGTSRQNTRHMMDILSKKGYVLLTTSKVDNRALCVSLTQKSLDFIKSHENNSNNFLGQTLKNISDDELLATIHVVKTLINLLEG